MVLSPCLSSCLFPSLALPLSHFSMFSFKVYLALLSSVSFFIFFNLSRSLSLPVFLYLSFSSYISAYIRFSSSYCINRHVLPSSLFHSFCLSPLSWSLSLPSYPRVCVSLSPNSLFLYRSLSFSLSLSFSFSSTLSLSLCLTPCLSRYLPFSIWVSLFLFLYRSPTPLSPSLPSPPLTIFSPSLPLSKTRFIASILLHANAPKTALCRISYSVFNNTVYLYVTGAFTVVGFSKSFLPCSKILNLSQAKLSAQI